MEAELEFLQKQGELSEELEGLNASLALKQALLASHAQQVKEGLGGGEEDGDDGAPSDEEVAALVEALAALEGRLKNVESERDTIKRQFTELRMHQGDEQGQPSKAAGGGSDPRLPRGWGRRRGLSSAAAAASIARPPPPRSRRAAPWASASLGAPPPRPRRHSPHS